MNVRMLADRNAATERTRHGMPGPVRALRAGEEHTVSAEYGAALVAGGYAVAVEAPPANTSAPAPDHTEPPAPVVPSAPPVHTTAPRRKTSGGRRRHVTG